MAWTAPRTWADGDVPSDDDLNAQLRDNHSFLSTHVHSGAAGQGDDELPNIDSITFDDQSASPAVAGELQRNGVNLEYYGAAVVAVTEADAVAGTASPRTLGTGARQASAGTHTHDPTETNSSLTSPSENNALGTVGLVRTTLTTGEQVLRTFNFTPGAARRSLAIMGFVWQEVDASGSATHSWELRLYVGGTLRATTAVGSRSHDGTDRAFGSSIKYTEVNPALVSTAIELRVIHNNDQAEDPVVAAAMLGLIEVKVS